MTGKALRGMILALGLLAGSATAGHAQATSALRLTTAPEGNEVRYRVREQLAGINFPGDAVGTTRGVTGALVLGPDGRPVAEDSRFVVNLASLTSDQSMRDNFIRGRTLQTAEYPTAELVVTSVESLPWPLPAQGRFSFTMVGDFTVKGVTLPTTWQVTAEPVTGGYRGTATTSFTFEDIRLAKPRVARVLSVEDQIRLEYDFHLVPAAQGR